MSLSHVIASAPRLLKDGIREEVFALRHSKVPHGLTWVSSRGHRNAPPSSPPEYSFDDCPYALNSFLLE